MKWTRDLTKNYRNSLSGKLILSVLLVSSVVSLFTTAIQVGFDYKQEVKIVEQNLLLVKKSHLDGIAGSLWNFDLEHLRTQLLGVTSLPGIRYVEIFDSSGSSVMVQGDKSKNDSLTATYPLIHVTSEGENQLGSIEVGASLQEVHNRLFQRIFVIFLTQFLKTIIVSTLIYFTVNQILIRHLLAISKYVKDVNIKNQRPALKLLRHTKEDSEDELDVLATSINQMQDHLFQAYREVQDFNEQLEMKVKANTAVIIEQRGKLEHTAKMSALGEMAGGMAHEINTPLAIIQLRTDQLVEHLKDEALDLAFMEKSLNSINVTIKRIATIINGLRSFARDGKNETMQTYSVSKIVEDTFGLCREHLVSHGVHLEYICEEDYLIKCRPVELSQVLLNLLNNARDAIQGQNEKWIKVQLQGFERFVELSVTDSGSGIPKDIQDKMMQPFFTTKEIGKGTGLGLSISKSLIQAHNGTLTIDNSVPNTKFVITLPL